MAGGKVVPLRRGTATDRAAPDLTALARRAVRDVAELEQLVESLESHPRLRALAATLARSLHPHDTDDLLQSTLERVVRGICSFRADGDLIGWVSRIMRNAQIELLRKEASEHTKVGGYGRESSREGSGDPADLIGDGELRHFALVAWTRTSHDPDVRLLWDRVYAGLSVDQLRSRSGEPRSTVYLKLRRGGEKLAREFAKLTLGRRST